LVEKFPSGLEKLLQVIGGGGGLTHIVHSVPLPGRARGWMLTNEPTNQRTNEPTNMIDHNTSWRI